MAVAACRVLDGSELAIIIQIDGSSKERRRRKKNIVGPCGPPSTFRRSATPRCGAQGTSGRSTSGSPLFCGLHTKFGVEKKVTKNTRYRDFVKIGDPASTENALAVR